jgi:hypothetical protein
MDIPFSPLRLTIFLARAPEGRKGWEEMTAIGMDDLELARLNQANTREPDSGASAGLRLIYGGGRPSRGAGATASNFRSAP